MCNGVSVSSAKHTFRTGGVELQTLNGRIRVTNTLEKRLQSISEQVWGKLPLFQLEAFTPMFV